MSSFFNRTATVAFWLILPMGMFPKYLPGTRQIREIAQGPLASLRERGMYAEYLLGIVVSASAVFPGVPALVLCAFLGYLLSITSVQFTAALA